MVGQTPSTTVPYDEHDDDGRFKRTYTNEMVLEAVKDEGGSASTSEVSNALGCSRRLALRRLWSLEEKGDVAAREIGNTYLWTVLEMSSGADDE
jgi:predicted ArsR family transcriptional regulator